MKVYTTKYPIGILRNIIEEVRTFPRDCFSATDIHRAVLKTKDIPYSKVISILYRIEKNGGIKRLTKNGKYMLFQREELVYSKTFDLTSSDRGLVLDIIKSLSNNFTRKDIFNIIGDKVSRSAINNYICRLIEKGEIEKEIVTEDGFRRIIFSKIPINTEGKMSQYEFVVRAIKNNRMTPYKVITDFNKDFKDYFGTDPIKATQRLAQEGKIVIQPRRRGVIMYLPEDAPKMKELEDVLGDILSKKFEEALEEVESMKKLEDTLRDISGKKFEEAELMKRQDKTQFDYIELGKSAEALSIAKSDKIRFLENENKALTYLIDQELHKEIDELKQDHRQCLHEINRLREQVREQKMKILDLNKKLNLNNSV